MSADVEHATLVAAFGTLPANIYLCAAAYQTADGGALAAQSPAGSGPDLDPNEFFVIPTIALRDNNADCLDFPGISNVWRRNDFGTANHSCIH